MFGALSQYGEHLAELGNRPPVDGPSLVHTEDTMTNIQKTTHLFFSMN